MGHLGHDAHTIAGAAVGVFACTVLQLFNNLQSLIHHAAFLPATDVRNRTDAASVVLELGSVKTVAIFQMFFHAVNPFMPKK